PLSTERMEAALETDGFNFNRMRFFFSLKRAKASAVKSFARSISKNNVFISAANVASIAALQTIIPPNAETGSPANASFQASTEEVRVASQQALLCLIIPIVTPSSSLNSEIRLRAASQSSKLL